MRLARGTITASDFPQLGQWVVMQQEHSVDAAQIEQKLDLYRERGANKVKLGLTDIDGVIRGKYVSLDKFAGLLADQGGFCDCVFGWDMDDQLYDAGQYTGWHTGFPDTGFKP